MCTLEIVFFLFKKGNQPARGIFRPKIIAYLSKKNYNKTNTSSSSPFISDLFIYFIFYVEVKIFQIF